MLSPANILHPSGMPGQRALFTSGCSLPVAQLNGLASGEIIIQRRRGDGGVVFMLHQAYCDHANPRIQRKSQSLRSGPGSEPVFEEITVSIDFVAAILLVAMGRIPGERIAFDETGIQTVQRI